MMRVAGYAGEEGARHFRRESFLDIASCDYRTIAEVCRRVAAHSREMAARSVRSMRGEKRGQDPFAGTAPPGCCAQKGPDPFSPAAAEAAE
jgi:hypothetical protein